jgi:Ala-tRNA(Pro) deacylase
MDHLLALLTDLKIPFTRYDHKAVFTCEESEGLAEPIPGAHTKQLLLRSKKKDRHLLAIVMHDKRVDTKALAKEYDVQSFSFASPEMLRELLGVTPGSVTPFGLTHDIGKIVEVIVDEDAWNTGLFRFHPMINTATLTIDREGFEKFLKHTRHAFTVRRIPQRTEPLETAKESV